MADDDAAVPKDHRAKSTQEMLAERNDPTLAGAAIRGIIGLAIVGVIAIGLFFGLGALDPKKDQKATAPWSHRGAIDVKPAPLADQ